MDMSLSKHSATHYINFLLLSMEKEKAAHSSTLAWRIPWTEEPGGYSLWGCKELDTTWQEWMKKKNGDFPGGSSG